MSNKTKQTEVLDNDNKPVKAPTRKRKPRTAKNGRGHFTPVSAKAVAAEHMQTVREMEAKGHTTKAIASYLKTSVHKIHRAKVIFDANDSGIETFIPHKDLVRSHLQANLLVLNSGSVDITIDALDRHKTALIQRDKGEIYDLRDIIPIKELSSLMKATSSAAKEWNNIDRLETGQSTQNLAINYLNTAHKDIENELINDPSVA